MLVKILFKDYHLKSGITIRILTLKSSGRKIGGSGESRTPIKNLESCWSEMRMI